MHESATVAPSHQDRIAGALLGLFIGDALGVPYEFHPPERLPERDAIDFAPPPGFARSHPGVPPGTWSDDGAQALCLLASLLHRGRLDLGDFSRRLINWADWGYLAVDGHVFDIGLQTSRAIASLRLGAAADTAGPATEHDNGNGALMRVLPLALWHGGDDEELVVMAASQSLPTHGHPRSQIACGMLCLWARAELRGEAQGWTWAASRLRQLVGTLRVPDDELTLLLDEARRDEARGSGYVVDTLWSARIAMERGRDFASSVRHAIALGNDTDTTAAVTGGIAGARYGVSGIPASWRQGLRGQDDLQPLLDALLRHAEPHSPR